MLSLSKRPKSFDDGFGLPQQSGPVGRVTSPGGGDDEDEAIQLENALTVEDCENILHPLKEAVDGLEEIQTGYPPVASLDVAMLRDPWMPGESCEMDFEQGGVSFTILGFKNKCDFSTDKGYRVAQEQLALLQPRWVVCNVPRGPERVRLSVEMDERSARRSRSINGRLDIWSCSPARLLRVDRRWCG